MEKEDLEFILLSDNILKSINDNLELLLKIIPELKLIIKYEHKNPHHYLDVWNHTLLSLKLSPNNLDIRLVLLLHDIGKPISVKEIRKVRHYKNHPYYSSIISYNVLNRLCYDKEYIDKICYLICMHDTTIKKEAINNNYDLEYKRFIIQYCDSLSHNPKKLDIRIEYLNKIELLFDEYNKNKRL